MVNNYISIVHVCFVLFVSVGWCCVGCVCMGCMGVLLCNNALSFLYSSCQYLYALMYVRLYFLLAQFIIHNISHSQKQATATLNSLSMQSKYVYRFMRVFYLCFTLE